MKHIVVGPTNEPRKVSPGNVVLAVLLVAAFAAVSRWLGFTAEETLTFLGAALMLAGAITSKRK